MHESQICIFGRKLLNYGFRDNVLACTISFWYSNMISLTICILIQNTLEGPRDKGKGLAI